MATSSNKKTATVKRSAETEQTSATRKKANERTARALDTKKTLSRRQKQ